MVNSILANRIKELRKARGVLQDDLARKIGVHKQTLSKYERGEVAPPAEILIKIAEFLRPNPTWLLIGEGQMFIDQQPPVLGVAEVVADYKIDTPENEQDIKEILELLRGNPKIIKPMKKLLLSGRSIKEALAELQETIDPTQNPIKQEG